MKIPYSTVKRSTKPLKRSRIKVRRKKSRVVAGRTILSGAAYTKLKDEVYERDGGMCQVCPELGRPSHFVSRIGMTLDHKIPRGLGGATRDDTPENTRTCCWWANYKKGSRRLDDKHTPSPTL